MGCAAEPAVVVVVVVVMADVVAILDEVLPGVGGAGGVGTDC